MSFRPVLSTALLCTFLLGTLCSCSHWEYAVPEHYAEQRLLPLSDDLHSATKSLNHATPSQAVGYSENHEGLRRAVKWTLSRGRRLNQAEPLSANPSQGNEEALDINLAGDVVGFRTSASGHSRAVFWRKSETINLHQKLLQEARLKSFRIVSSRATSIDDQGRVGGQFEDAKGMVRAFIFTDERFTVIQASAPKLQVSALNGATNMLVGASTRNGSGAQSFRIDLTQNPPREELLDVEGLVFSEAFDVNQHGHIVGANRAGLGVASSAFLSVKGRFRDLGVLRGAISSVALAVNSRTKIVGYSKLRNGDEHAFIWAPAFSMVDLNQRVLPNANRVLTQAHDINDQEIVVGKARYGEVQNGFALLPERARETAMTCAAYGPARVLNTAVIKYQIQCTNRTARTFEKVIIQSEIPNGTEFVAIKDGGGQQAPDEAFKQGSLQWKIADLGPGQEAAVHFSVRLRGKTKLVRLSRFSATAGAIRSHSNDIVMTQIEQSNTKTGLHFISPSACQSLAVGSDIDFELAVHGFNASRIDLRLGEESIASDDHAPWLFSLKDMPAGIHCFKAVATSSSGLLAGSASTCMTVGLAENHRAVYQVVQLAAAGGKASGARAIDESGDVVGWTQDETGKVKAALWMIRDEDGQIKGEIQPTVISTTGICDENNGARSVAIDITSNGQIVGSCGPIWKQSSFVWKAGRMTKVVIGDQSNLATAINTKGQVVGRLGGGSGASHAFSWRPGSDKEGQVSYLYGLANSPSAIAQDINDQGLVAGASIELQSRAVLWVDDVATALTPSGRLSRAFALSNGLEPFVVGEMKVAGQMHAFRFSKSTGLVDLHDEALGQFSHAHGVNDFGQVVGQFDGGQSQTPKRAFLHSCGRRFDLNSLLPKNSNWVLENAIGINHAGEIVGSGLYQGARRGFVLIPLN